MMADYTGPTQEVSITDLLVKIGSLTVELDIARGQIQQLLKEQDDFKEQYGKVAVDTTQRQV